MSDVHFWVLFAAVVLGVTLIRWDLHKLSKLMDKK